MNLIVPPLLIKLAQSMPAPLYVVGGACRNAIGGLTAEQTDWDICAPVDAESVAKLAQDAGFTVTATYKNTGTVLLKADGQEYEYTCFRTDKYVRGAHTPVEIYFTDDIQKDARRRDFKCNAVYYDVLAQKYVDPLGGIEDVKNRRINTVVSAEKVFGEDGLRLMRLCRISAQLGFIPTVECMEGAIKNSALIADIAPERIRAELELILNADAKYGVNDAHYQGLKLLKSTGVLSKILPELALGDGMYQRSDYHDHDVLEHTFRCVLYAPREIRLAALLHDVGKPRCKQLTGKFACHETVGEELAQAICQRLRFPNKTVRRVCELVRWHMYDLSGEASVNKVKKFIISHLDLMDDLLKLKQADFSASKDDLSVAPCVVRWSAILNGMRAEGVPMRLGELNVRGDELIAAGIAAEDVGKTLNFLLGECAIGSVPNERERLIRLAKGYCGVK